MPASAPITLTPTARLARDLARRAALEQADRGKAAWLTEPVYSYAAWLARLREHYFLTADDHRVPLTAQQAELLWQSLIDRDVFVGEPRVAELALRAWRTLHEYRLQPPEQWQAVYLSEDSGRFRSWAASYRTTCARRGLVDEWAFAAEIPGLVAEGRMDTPAAIRLAGFDLPLTPLQEDILNAFRDAGTEILRDSPERPAAFPTMMHQFDRPEDELHGAARWARTLLEADPGRSIAIVVPDLAGRVDQAERVFRQVLDPPGSRLQATRPEPWHVSLGRPLGHWPLVGDALAMLRLAPHELSQPEAGRLLGSPYLAGWTHEATARHRTLAELARRAPYHITASELRWALEATDAPELAGRLEAWQRLRGESASRAWPSEWAGRFQEELSSLGFAGGRGLDSREYQVLRRWHHLLESFAALDAVLEEPVSRQRALELLADRAAGTIFRERNPGVPIEILGVEEALGSTFDAIWITTLDSDTWPGPARRDPLIPAAVQATVPRAGSEGCLERARLELEGLFRCAATVQGSFARGSDEAAAEITALLPDPTVQAADAPPAPDPAPMAPPLQDSRAPVLEGNAARGGTGVLRDQSYCPFRAFARRRLQAQDLTPPRPGLDAGQRGTVVHKALERFWSDLEGSDQLEALSPADQEARVRAAVGAALDDLTRRYRLILPPAGRRLEQRCVERILARWLEVERQRDHFTVLEHERRISLTLAGLTLTGQIDRLDRLEDGGLMLLDYKTGSAGSRTDWYPEARLADPQLPAYAVSMDPAPDAVAFARVLADKPKFDGLSRDATGTPGVGPVAEETRKFADVDSWEALLDGWRAHLEALAEDFRAGRAEVDPRKPDTCRYCHLHALCRIGERAPYASLEDDRD